MNLNDEPGQDTSNPPNERNGRTLRRKYDGWASGCLLAVDRDGGGGGGGARRSRLVIKCMAVVHGRC